MQTKHDQENIVRVAIVQDDKTKENDKKKGVQMTLENAMAALDNCEFGLWTNGIDIKYLQREDDAIGFDYIFSDLSDIPGFGENINDLERPERSHSRKPANDSLIKVFKRSHDYIYANEGRKKDAFWQLLYLIFCKPLHCFLLIFFVKNCSISFIDFKYFKSKSFFIKKISFCKFGYFFFILSNV
jgi:type I restriction enzyme M protein